MKPVSRPPAKSRTLATRWRRGGSHHRQEPQGGIHHRLTVKEGAEAHRRFRQLHRYSRSDDGMLQAARATALWARLRGHAVHSGRGCGQGCQSNPPLNCPNSRSAILPMNTSKPSAPCMTKRLHGSRPATEERVPTLKASSAATLADLRAVNRDLRQAAPPASRYGCTTP